MIAALPDSDLVIVNRADTYEDESTPMGPLLALIEEILAARTGEPVADPKLVPLEERERDARFASSPAMDVGELVGTWSEPPAVFGWPAERTVQVALDSGRLVWTVPGWGTFGLFAQPDGTLLEEDSHRTLHPVRDESGAVAGIADADTLANGALFLAATGKVERAEELLALLSEGESVELTRALLHALSGDFEDAVSATLELARRPDTENVERRINATGYAFLRAGEPETALTLFELNTMAFPESSNAWDSLAEAHMELGHHEDALEFYQVSLDLNADNENARAMMAKIREAASGE
jgi:hypothetical protein